MTEGKPVAVLGEPHPIPPELERCGDRLRVVGIDLSPASGARVAQYLLRLGHRRIAYIDPTNGSPNAVFRLRGLEREFDAAGIADAVRTISYTTPPLREHGPHTEQQNLMRGISALASELSAAPRTLIGGELSSLLGEQLSHAQRDIQSRAASVEHFDRLLNDPTITAWVGFNDQIALAALDYLDAHKVPVPRRISVLGFDDSFESFARGMTSYDFNLPVCVQTMLKHVLHWSKNRGPKQRIIREEIPGFIKIRGTVAPPPA